MRGRTARARREGRWLRMGPRERTLKEWARVANLRITQVRSSIGRPPKQRGTLRALGLKRINHTVTQEDRPEIRGMLAVVSHLVRVEEEEDSAAAKDGRGKAGDPR